MKIRFELNHLILGLLIVMGFFLIFYDFENRFSLGWESNRDFVISDIGFQEKQLPLTGPWASIAPLTTGPWYWYYLILSRVFIPSSYAPWIMIGLTSVATVFVMYKIGVLLENEKLGLILALITTLSPHLIENSLLLTNTSPIVFLTSVVILVFLYLFLEKRKWYWGLLFGWLVGITLLTHYQGAGLLFLIPLLFFLKKNKLKTLFASLLGLLIASLPILFFELNNHWFNTRGILDFILHTQYRLWTPMRWKTFVFDFYPQVWATFTGGANWLGLVLMFSSGL
ncbi:glycosyltransferase family 39 protein, partial [Candidatus Gottesmanbacteria bacterium]|nr:glycosyltransferase family 39 protein [Candidatus Gottesmanbacteria bacterium]